MAPRDSAVRFDGEPTLTSVGSFDEFSDYISTTSSTSLPNHDSETAALLEEQGHTIDAEHYSLRPVPDKIKQEQLKKARARRSRYVKVLVATAAIGALGLFVVRSVQVVLSPKTLLTAWDGIQHHDEYPRLPKVSEAEQLLPMGLRQGKAQLEAAIKRRDERRPPAPSDAVKSVLEDFALQLSGGRTSQISGLPIRLNNYRQLGSGFAESVPRDFTITKFLGEGASSMVLEIYDGATESTHALRFYKVPNSYGGNSLGKLLARIIGYAGMVQETSSMIQACGTTELHDAQSDRGLALIAGIAQVEGMPHVIAHPSMCLLKDVYVMERLHGDMSGIFTAENALPMSAKQYAARRLVLEVLLLQSAGLSHNDLKLENYFMREDGSFLVGDFGSVTGLDDRLARLTGVTPLYAEPELLLDLVNQQGVGLPPFVNAKSDMWSLGISLYRIFMDEELPYAIDQTASVLDHVNALFREGTRPTTERSRMTRAGVPERWQSMIMQLLEVHRKDRIGAEALALNYMDLLT